MLPDHFTDEPLWCDADLAQFLKIDEGSLRKRRMTGGGIPYVKIGHLVRYVPSVVRAHIAGRLQSSTSEIVPDAISPAREYRNIPADGVKRLRATPHRDVPTDGTKRPRGRPRKIPTLAPVGAE